MNARGIPPARTRCAGKGGRGVTYLAWGIPTLAGGGYLIWWGLPTLDGGVPTLDQGSAYPWQAPSPNSWKVGTPPLQHGCEQTDTCENSTFPIFRMRAVASIDETMYYKKVLLRERKRHTARHVAIASACYSGGGVPLRNFFFPVWTCIKPNLVSKNFPLLGGGGVPLRKIFFPVWTCIKPNLVSKIFPFTGRGGGPSSKIFFPVWTCIKPNLVSKIFPFTGGGGSLFEKFFFPVWTCIKQNPVSKIFPFNGGGYLEMGYPPVQGWGTPPEMGYPPSKAGSGPPPHPRQDWTPPSKAGSGTPPVDRHTNRCQNITFPSYYVRGR